LFEVFMLGLASQNGHSELSVPRGAVVPGRRPRGGASLPPPL